MADVKRTKKELVAGLNEDLAREYQAIIAYVNYSQVLKGAEYMNIAEELEVHASEELAHALAIAKQIDYLGEMPTVVPKKVKTSDKAKDMLQLRPRQRARNHRQLPRAHPPGRIARRVRDVRSPPRDHHPGTRTRHRPGHRAGHRRPADPRNQVIASNSPLVSHNSSQTAAPTLAA